MSKVPLNQLILALLHHDCRCFFIHRAHVASPSSVLSTCICLWSNIDYMFISEFRYSLTLLVQHNACPQVAHGSVAWPSKRTPSHDQPPQVLLDRYESRRMNLWKASSAPIHTIIACHTQKTGTQKRKVTIFLELVIVSRQQRLDPDKVNTVNILVESYFRITRYHSQNRPTATQPQYLSCDWYARRSIYFEF